MKQARRVIRTKRSPNEGHCPLFNTKAGKQIESTFEAKDASDKNSKQAQEKQEMQSQAKGIGREDPRWAYMIKASA